MMIAIVFKISLDIEFEVISLIFGINVAKI